jgi:hypothetical protein
MTFAQSLKSFSVRSWHVRASAFGLPANWQSQAIQIVVMPQNGLEQMAGGYEDSETIRIETDAKVELNHLVQFDGKKYRVQDVRTSAFSPTRTATLIVSP